MDNTYNSSLEDAWDHIRFHFTHYDGLLSKVVRGEEIDNKQIAIVEKSLERLQLAWQDETLIPKRDVQFLWNNISFSTLANSMFLYPQKAREIRHLVLNLSRWMYRLFSLPTEEKAIATIRHHLINGAPSFVAQIHRGKIDQGAVLELTAAIDELENRWKGRVLIPKTVISSFFSAKDITWRVTGVYSEEEIQELENIEKILSDRIAKCLEV